MGTGGHFNPFSKEHGAPHDENRHVGTLRLHTRCISQRLIIHCFSPSPQLRRSRQRGTYPISSNILFGSFSLQASDAQGVVNLNIEDAQVSLNGPFSVVGCVSRTLSCCYSF